MFLWLFLGIAMAESCINLDANSPCGPAFQGAPVFFKSMEEFLNIINSFKNTSNIIDQINSTGSCSILNDDALKHQYQTSFFCAFMVEDALVDNGCQSVAPFVPQNSKLCSKVCNVYRDSISKSLSSCQNPNNITGGINYFCSMKTSGEENNCFAGIKSDVDTCGFVSVEAANIGCPTLREDEMDAECCKKLIPGVLLLPKQTPVNMPIVVGFAIAVGVGAFLVLVAMLVSCVWCTTFRNKRSKDGNSILKSRGVHDSFSSSSSDSKPIFIPEKKPVEFEQKALPQNDEFKYGSQIRMENPYLLSVKSEPQYLVPEEPNRGRIITDYSANFVEDTDNQLVNRESMVSDFSANFAEYSDTGLVNRESTVSDYSGMGLVNRESMISDFSGVEYFSPQTRESMISVIDLGKIDVLDVSGQAHINPNQYLSRSPTAVSDRDSDFFIRNPQGAQSIYSNVLLQQFSQVGEGKFRNLDSLYSMSTDQFIVDENRDSLAVTDSPNRVSFKFPQPPPKPPQRN